MDSTRNVDYRELIKESISDSSSESSESSSSSSSEDDSSSDSSESLVLEITAVDEAGDHRVQESAADTSFDGFLGPEPPEAVDIEDFPSPHKRTVRADSLVSNSSQQSSASLQVRHPTTIPDTSEPVPLRKRAYSDLQEKDSLRHQAQKNFIADKESPERWRSRLWPGKAIIAYARMILRCHPPSVTIGVPINSGSRVDTLRPYWTEGEFVRIGSNFDSVNTHNSAFFLLNAEESRAAVANGEESAADEDNKPTMDHRGNYSSGSSGSGNGWLDCEVVHIVAESELGTARPNDKDTRQGSVWVVKVEFLCVIDLMQLIDNLVSY